MVILLSMTLSVDVCSCAGYSPADMLSTAAHILTPPHPSVMRSQLTRQVFRQILNNEPHIHHSCCYGAKSSDQLRKFNRRAPHHVNTRSLFGFSRKPPRETKEADLDPGFGTMLELTKMIKMQTRPPPASALVKAFSDFFWARQKVPTPLEEVQAKNAKTTFKHLQETYQDVAGFGLTTGDLQRALIASMYLPQTGESTEHNQFARLLFAEIMKRRESGLAAQDSKTALGQKDLLPFIQVLTLTGDSLDARDLLEEYWLSDLEQGGRSPWHRILKGFAKENNDGELLNTVTVMETHGVPFDAEAHQAITFYYAQKGDIEAVKKWYKHPISGGEMPLDHTNEFVLKLCIRHDELQWGNAIFKSMLEKTPNQKSWNVVFQWAAANGKGVDEIERMMHVMVRRNEERGSKARPDIETINGLVELANSKNDPYTAERYVALGHKWRLQPNAQTYLLQLDYRLKVGDIAGARAAYGRLQAEEVLESKDLPLINKLIVALCSAKSQDYEAIMRLVGDLNERKARFEPDTVAALSMLHLQREELHDLIDLLQTHTFHYGLEQRAAIRDVIMQFCLDRANSTSRVWDAYSILRTIFAETGIDIRTRLMNEFFARKRCDMACHVFGHMRQNPLKDQRPAGDTYVECLQGIARAGDPESLEMVHNMLKLDSEIEPNTRLYNALMLGYTACEMPSRSLQFWDDIVYSIEGPTYNSIQIALRACEAMPFGERPARDIWGRLKKFDIEVTKEIFAAYVGALAHQALFLEVVKLIDNMESETGCQPDALT